VKVLTARRGGGVLALLSVAVAGSVALGLAAGPSGLPLRQAVSALLAPEAQGAAADIVLRVRLPRVLLSLLVGASLAVAGVLFQALLRNPLADPFVLGVSGGAALGGIAVPDPRSASRAADPPRLASALPVRLLRRPGARRRRASC
jgi:ABC-type Fe3+-siderophore transport system permease subunit